MEAKGEVPQGKKLIYPDAGFVVSVGMDRTLKMYGK